MIKSEEKMKREKVIEWLQTQVNFLEANNVLRLLEEGDTEKIAILIGKIDYSILDEYLREKGKRLNLGSTEIEGNPVLLALIINSCSHGDYKIFCDYIEFEKILKQKGGEVGNQIAEKMPRNYLNQLQIKDFFVTTSF